MTLKTTTSAGLMKRRQLSRVLGLFAAGALVSASCLAQTPSSSTSGTYPTKPVRLIVGFPAGTGPDIVARLLGQKLSEAWGMAWW